MITRNNSKKTKGTRAQSSSARAEEKDFSQEIVDIARVTRVMAGGKRMRFRASVIVGDRRGKVGTAVAKGADVTLAVNKAVKKARKNLISVPIVNETIPHRVDVKSGAAKILIKPAPKGTGIIAGGAVRMVLDLAGVSNVVAKILGSKNKINNVNATIKALKMLKRVEPKKSAEDEKKIKADKTAEAQKEKSE